MGGILKAADALTAQNGLIHRGGILKVGNGEAVLVLEALGVGRALRAGLDGNILAGQVGKAGNVGVLGHGQRLVGIIVAVGEHPAARLALVGDGGTGDHGVRLTGLAGRDGGVPAKALQLILKALILGDGGEDIHINADKVAGSIGVLKGLKDRVSSHDPLFAGGLGRGSLRGGGVSGCSRRGGRSGSSAAAGSERQGHNGGHTERKQFFHGYFPFHSTNFPPPCSGPGQIPKKGNSAIVPMCYRP